MIPTFPPALRPRAAALVLAGLATALAGCGGEAGRAVRSAEFGTATMNNHLVQTCAAGVVSPEGKYTSKLGGCPGRSLDGKYAQATYEGYVESAAARPEVIRTLDE